MGVQSLHQNYGNLGDLDGSKLWPGAYYRCFETVELVAIFCQGLLSAELQLLTSPQAVFCGDCNSPQMGGLRTVQSNALSVYCHDAVSVVHTDRVVKHVTMMSPCICPVVTRGSPGLVVVAA